MIHTEKECYFAAANSYRGFVSYFDKVFNSNEYERVYVLKGGPGTGKSSFMKKIAEEMTTAECHCQEILCSSDPNSLDGIIVCKNSKKIAVLDGTAPHERDAVIPGAIDQIINLGSCWDDGWLMAKKDEIVPLCNEKAKAYFTAYSYLSIAGEASEYIYSVYNKDFDKSKAKIKAEEIFYGFHPEEDSRCNTRLISSFGKSGEYIIDTANKLAEKHIGVGKNKYLTSLFLDCCFDVLKQRKIRFTHFPCALEPNHTEALLIPQNNLLLSFAPRYDICAEEFSSADLYELEQIKCAENIILAAKEEAKRWFAIASDLHFRLEKIYTEAMNFDKNDKILEDKIKEIRFILDL